MPTSHFYQLNEIVECIVLTDPQSILDIGVGFGKYGFLSREYLELWDGRQKYYDFKRRIDGIEAWKDYITPIHNFVYDHIYIGNAEEIVPKLKTSYDLIILVDILEHLDYENGIKLLYDCQKIAKNILVSTPKNIGDQKDSFGNPFEIHRFQWRKKHFSQFHNFFSYPNKHSLICYLGEGSLKIKKNIFKKRIKTWLPFLAYPYQIVRRLFGFAKL